VTPGLCLGVRSAGGRKGFPWRPWDFAARLWCWSGGAGDPGGGRRGRSDGDEKALEVRDAALGVTDRDAAMPAPALAKAGGSEYPSLGALGCSAGAGVASRLKKAECFAFRIFPVG